MNTRSISLVLGLLAFGPVVSAQVVSDDFDDGMDDGWIRADPLEELPISDGVMTFSFPGGNSYRLQADPSPAPAAGGGRGGSIRPEEYEDSFHIEVDLVAWDDTLRQDVGILAFITNPGLGTLNGYAFSYDVAAQSVFISRLEGEEPNSLGSVEVVLDPNKDYRLIFEGFQGSFRGDVIDLADPSVPLVTVGGFDESFSLGRSGLFVTDNSPGGTGTADATFDNYHSSSETDTDFDGMSDQWEVDNFGDTFWFGDEDVDEDGQDNLTEFIGGSDPNDPGSLSGALQLRVADGNLAVSFHALDGRSYSLETSPDLENWTTRPDAGFSREGDVGSLTIPAEGEAELYVRVTATLE